MLLLVALQGCSYDVSYRFGFKNVAQVGARGLELESDDPGAFVLAPAGGVGEATAFQEPISKMNFTLRRHDSEFEVGPTDFGISRGTLARRCLRGPLHVGSACPAEHTFFADRWLLDVSHTIEVHSKSTTSTGVSSGSAEVQVRLALETSRANVAFARRTIAPGRGVGVAFAVVGFVAVFLGFRFSGAEDAVVSRIGYGTLAGGVALTGVAAFQLLASEETTYLMGTAADEAAFPPERPW